MYRVTLIEGGGIGPEVGASARRVVEAVGLDVEWEPVAVGLDVEWLCTKSRFRG